MSTPKAPPLSEAIVQEATTWFVENNEGELALRDREAFVEWLKRSPEHIRAYLNVTAHWEDAGALPARSLPSIAELILVARENGNVVPIVAAKRDEAQTRARAVPAAAGAAAASLARKYPARRYLFAASVGLAVVGISALYWLKQERGIYATAVGEQRSIHLSDGSTLELNAHSKLRVTLREHERDVELIDGQAMFRVAKDHSRPFIVRSGASEVRAVGTQFDVNKHRSGTTITVIEGRVAVLAAAQPNSAGPEPASRSANAARPAQPATAQHAAGSEVFLDPGEQLTVSGAAMSKVANADVAAVTAWTQQRIFFSATPLADVVDEFNRYNERQLVIVDPRIANTRVSGEFSSTNPDSLLKGLDGLGQFNIRETPGRIEISGK